MGVLLGLGLSVAGKLLGGGSRKRAAKKLAKKVERIADQGIAETVEDQRRALELNAADEARLRAATGYDLVKLRDDAVRSGFNPLTVLGATGGAGYEGRGAVLASPFISRAQAYFDKAGLVAGVGQNVVETSGYVGDSVGELGRGLFDLGMERERQAFEMSMQRSAIMTQMGSGGMASASPFQGARRITASNVKSTRVRPKANPLAKIKVYTPEGKPLMVSKSWAQLNNIPENYFFSPGDWEMWGGEAGQAASVASMVPEYADIVSPGLGDTIRGYRSPFQMPEWLGSSGAAPTRPSYGGRPVQKPTANVGRTRTRIKMNP